MVGLSPQLPPSGPPSPRHADPRHAARDPAYGVRDGGTAPADRRGSARADGRAVGQLDGPSPAARRRRGRRVRRREQRRPDRRGRLGLSRGPAVGRWSQALARCHPGPGTPERFLADSRSAAALRRRQRCVGDSPGFGHLSRRGKPRRTSARRHRPALDRVSHRTRQPATPTAGQCLPGCGRPGRHGLRGGWARAARGHRGAAHLLGARSRAARGVPGVGGTRTVAGVGAASGGVRGPGRSLLPVRRDPAARRRRGRRSAGRAVPPGRLPIHTGGRRGGTGCGRATFRARRRRPRARPWRQGSHTW